MIWQSLLPFESMLHAKIEFVAPALIQFRLHLIVRLDFISSEEKVEKSSQSPITKNMLCRSLISGTCRVNYIWRIKRRNYRVFHYVRRKKCFILHQSHLCWSLSPALECLSLDFLSVLPFAKSRTFYKNKLMVNKFLTT